MVSRVFRSPGSPDPDKAPWERKQAVAARAETEAAANRPAQAVLNRLNRARGPRGKEPASESTPPPTLEVGDADAQERQKADEFWGSAKTDEQIPAIATSIEFLSGEEDFFDPATGWDFNAITDSQIEAVEAARAESPAPVVAAAVQDTGDVAIEIEIEEEAEAAAPPITVDDALGRAQALFQLERDGDALEILAAALRLAPKDPRLSTWVEFGERRVMRRLCPTAALDRVPKLGHSLDALLSASTAEQAATLRGIDGIANAATVRDRLGMGAVSFWTAMGRLAERGWIVWLDDA